MNYSKVSQQINDVAGDNVKKLAQLFPSPAKTELYRHFVDLGARAVIAMHTHCPQGYEIYNGCPIIYSMGNFFFPLTRNRISTWDIGYMTMLDITKEKYLICFEIGYP